MPDTETPEPDDLLNTDAESVIADAKATFSLEKRLSGLTLATGKVLVFTDLEAAAEWAEQEQRTNFLGSLVAQRADGSPEKAEALEDFNHAEAELEQRRDAAFASALAVHMRAVPQAALDRANRKARKDLDLGPGNVPADKQGAFFERQNQLLLPMVVQKIVDSEGRKAEFPKEQLYDLLHEALPIPQFQRVLDAYNALMFNDTLGRAATQEAGF